MKWVHTPLATALGLSTALPWDITWPEAIALFCFPIAFYKNLIVNVVQLWKASKMLVGVDIAERQAAREAAQKAQAASLKEREKGDL